MFEGNLGNHRDPIPFEGDPNDCSIARGLSSRSGVNISDPEIISALRKSGVDGPTIFGLVWGFKMGYQPHRFPEELTKIVRSIEEHTKKKKEARDAQECVIQGIILDLLQVLYEKEVNDIVDVILKK